MNFINTLHYFQRGNGIVIRIIFTEDEIKQLRHETKSILIQGLD